MQQNDKLYEPRKSNECMCGCGENEESEGKRNGRRDLEEGRREFDFVDKEGGRACLVREK